MTRAIYGAAALALVLAAPLQAQDAPAPQRSVETFGAWELRCERAEEGSVAPPLSCEIVQTTTMQNSAQPITQIAVGYPAPDAPLVAVVALPLGLWLPSGASIDLGPTGGLHALQIDRCLPNGCISQIDLTPEMQVALTDPATAGAQMQFEMQKDQPVRIPVVTDGFSSALSALALRLGRDTTAP